MKPIRLLILLFTIGFLFQLSSCDSKSTPTVGILLHSYENARWTKDKDYLVEDLTKLGAKVLLEVADNNQDRQIEQAKKMIKDGAKVLIVVAIDQDRAAEIVELAHDADVKVIAYDRLINGCKLDYYITANSTQIGELQASYITSLKPSGNYALIPGSRYDDNSMKLFLGQMRILQSYMEDGSIQVFYSEFTEDWSTEQARIHTKALLDQADGPVTAILTGSDAVADGVLLELRERGLEGKIMVTGQDAELDNVQAVMKGEQTCDILKPLKQMAQISAEIAVAIATDKPLEMKFSTESNGQALVKSILIDATVVNKNNIESTVVASGFHTAAELNQ